MSPFLSRYWDSVGEGIKVERAPKSDKTVVLDRHHSPGAVHSLLSAEECMLPLVLPYMEIYFFFNK